MTDLTDDSRSPARPGATPRRRPVAVSALRRVGQFLVDWLPILFVLFAYDEIHNRLGSIIPPAHTFPQIRAEEALFGAPVPTVRLQLAVYSTARPHWWDLAALAIYMSHFAVAVIIALALWFRSRPRYLRFMTAFVGMTTLGYITYVLYPAVPPWLASQHGDLAPTHRIVREMWDALGCHTIAAGFSATNLYANDVAAIPSLHAAYPLMIALLYWGVCRPATRIVMALYVVIMALTLVYTAEHYVVDILLGWLYAVVTAFAMQRLWPATARASARPVS